MWEKGGILRMMLTALTCTTGLAVAQANAPERKVVLQCAGTVRNGDQMNPEESGVILDFDKRLVFYGGLTFRIENVTETFVGFTMYDDVKHIAVTGGLDRVTGTFTLSATRGSVNLKCTPREQRF
jgi:hypothetical protein